MDYAAGTAVRLPKKEGCAAVRGAEDVRGGRLRCRCRGDQADARVQPLE